MLNTIPVSFFAYCMNEENEPDVLEITESQFIDLKNTPHATLSYKRHTVHENGVNQVVLTVETQHRLCRDDIERI